MSVTGFGVTEDGAVSDRLMEVVVKTNTNGIGQNYGSSLDEDTMFTASDPTKDSCQGDSGGPVFQWDDDKQEALHIGVVSWG